MAFDGIICSAIVAELNSSILNGKINKIFQPNKNELILGIYFAGKNFALDACISPVNYRISLTTQSKPNPKNVYNFCMVLRKHLIGGTIKRIYMSSLDRIIYIDIDCYNELNDHITKTLVFELMGKHSNIILINSSNIIIDSLRHLNKLDNSIRNILPGSEYVAIENNKLDFLSSTFDCFYNCIKNSTNISSAISNNFIGFSKSGIEYILQDLKFKDINNISLADCKILYQYIKFLLNNINNDILKVSCIHRKNLSRDDFYVTNKVQDGLQINFFIDDFYYEKETNEQFINSKNNALRTVLGKIKKLSEKLKNINSKLEDCSKMDIYRLYGELITTNLYRISNYNQSSVTIENYYNNNFPITIPLDSTISPSANARNFFKKCKKLQNTCCIVKKQQELVKAELDYLDSIIYEINSTTSLDDLNNSISELFENSNQGSDVALPSKKHLKNTSNFPTEYKIDGYTVLVGKNNKQNDNLTCKIANRNDLWFHTKDIHGSHVVLRLEKNTKEVNDSIIYRCATIAAYFSKAKLSQNVPVDYTYIKYVKKPNGAKPGMVTYTNNKTLYVNPKSPA